MDVRQDVNIVLISIVVIFRFWRGWKSAVGFSQNELINGAVQDVETEQQHFKFAVVNEGIVEDDFAVRGVEDGGNQKNEQDHSLLILGYISVCLADWNDF